jgi:hypothetical protein
MDRDFKWIGWLALLAIIIVFAIIFYGNSSGGLLGGIDNIDLNRGQSGRPEIGSFVCGTTSSLAIASLSGRNWVRMQTTLGSAGISSSPVSLAMTTNTASFATIGQGIELDSATSSGGREYWDSGESGINWTGSFHCVAVVTGTVVSYIQAN